MEIIQRDSSAVFDGRKLKRVEAIAAGACGELVRAALKQAARFVVVGIVLACSVDLEQKRLQLRLRELLALSLKGWIAQGAYAGNLYSLRTCLLVFLLFLLGCVRLCLLLIGFAAHKRRRAEQQT